MNDSTEQLFVCRDGWAHDIESGSYNAKCRKCGEYLDILVKKFADQAYTKGREEGYKESYKIYLQGGVGMFNKLAKSTTDTKGYADSQKEGK